MPKIPWFRQSLHARGAGSEAEDPASVVGSRLPNYAEGESGCARGGGRTLNGSNPVARAGHRTVDAAGGGGGSHSVRADIATGIHIAVGANATGNRDG